MSGLREYTGSCHCGLVKFSFEWEEIRSGLRCNCSICRRKGILMSDAYIPRSAFRVFQGFEDLAVYNFGDLTVNNFFCKKCGIHPFHNVIADPERFRLNLGCIDQLEPQELPVRWVDGKSF